MMTSEQHDAAVLHAEERVNDLVADYFRMYFRNRLPTPEEMHSLFGLASEEGLAALDEGLRGME